MTQLTQNSDYLADHLEKSGKFRLLSARNGDGEWFDVFIFRR